MIYLKNANEIELMKEAGRITALAHKAAEEAIEVGISTFELSAIIERTIRSHGAEPSFKGYGGFPAAACISINDIVIHGIPSKTVKLKEGDIVSIDIGAKFKGFHGDAARTWGVGEISPENEKLIDITKKAFYAGMNASVEGKRVSDISKAVQTLAENEGFGVVRDYVGHGVGRGLHEEPEIPNFCDGRKGQRLQSGMVIAIEPMINLGDFRVETSKSDKWTVTTIDGKASAHYENTILITKGQPIILTEC